MCMDFLLFNLHQGYLCFHLRLFVSGLVGLSAGLQQKKQETDFQETWMKDRSGPRIDPINFWCRSRWKRWIHGIFLTSLNMVRWEGCFFYYLIFWKLFMDLKTSWLFNGLVAMCLCNLMLIQIKIHLSQHNVHWALFCCQRCWLANTLIKMFWHKEITRRRPFCRNAFVLFVSIVDNVWE